MKSKEEIAVEVVTAVQVLNLAINKAEAAGMEVDLRGYSSIGKNSRTTYKAKVFESSEKVYAESPEKQDGR